jgi:hypothetical protein
MKPKRVIVERRQPVEIKDVSRSGCCLESGQLLPPGAFGVLVVEIEGQPHAEVFRVTRSGAAQGDGNQYQAGIEFLPMPAEIPSLAEVVAELDYCEKPAGDGRRLRDSE